MCSCATAESNRETAYLPGLCVSSVQAVVAQGQKPPLAQSIGVGGGGLRNFPKSHPRPPSPATLVSVEREQVNTSLAAALFYDVPGLTSQERK